MNFSEYSKSIGEEQNLQKVAKLLYIFLITPGEIENCIHCYNVEILNIFDPELQLLHTKPMIKNKLKEFLSELKKFKVQTVLVLDLRKEMIIKSSIQGLH